VPIRRLAPLASALVVAACGGGASTATPAQTVTLFAAASTAAAMGEEITEFEARHPGVTVQGDYEGTQALLTKLQADPTSADVFLSADLRHMNEAAQQGLVRAPRDLAANRLAIALPPGNPQHILAPRDLARPGLRIVLADTSVPAGAYAEQALHLIETHGDAPSGFAAKVLANVVSRESDVEQVVTKVASGEADAGIVYVTDAHANAHISALQIPLSDQPATVYPVALTAQAKDREGAQEFLDFLFSTDGQHVLHTLGFLAPPTPAATSSPSGSASP
jgi:molybdate transport system substrate-binding protein